jgi:hypothetical protein
MLFILEDDIFEAAPVNELIAFLTSAARSGRHIAVPQSPDSEKYYRWIKGLGLPLQKEIEQIIDVFFRDSSSLRARQTCRVRPNGKPESVSTIRFDEAQKLILRPLSIYVENNRNDRAFLLAACTEDQRLNFLRLEENHELRFVHGGGITELRMQINTDVANGSLSTKNAFCFFDSDALVPGRASSQAKELIDTCIDAKLGYYCLTRRSIESYLTLTSVKDWVFRHSGNKHSPLFRSRKRTFSAFVSVAQTFRWHYNMKLGIKGDAKHNDKPIGVNLYANLTAAELNALDSGFGKDVATMYDLPAPEADLRKDGSWLELQGLVNKLENML